MNDRPVRTALAYAAGILGSFLIVAVLVWAMHSYTQPPPLGEQRAKERAQALAKLRAEEAEALSTPAWLDPNKGIVRLPIEAAMKIVERDWGQNPVAARSNLVSRVEKATEPPPKVPEKPSPLE